MFFHPFGMMGGLVTSVISNGTDGQFKFDIGDSVYVQCQNTFDIYPVTIAIPPTSNTKFYTVKLDDCTSKNVLPQNIYIKDTVPASGKPSVSMGFFCPHWLKQDQKVTLLQSDVYQQGYLDLNDDNLWEFVKRDTNGTIIYTHNDLDP